MLLWLISYSQADLKQNRGQYQVICIQEAHYVFQNYSKIPRNSSNTIHLTLNDGHTKIASISFNYAYQMRDPVFKSVIPPFSVKIPEYKIFSQRI